MPLPSKPPKSRRDGTSQNARKLTALAPDYVPVDDSRIRDWLAYLEGLAGKLRFFDLQNPELDLDWSGLFRGVDLDQLAAVSEADISDSDLAQRPHLALLVAFLRLLKHTQGHLNGFTRRHLEFYYREVLRMRERAPQPDHVNLMFQLADRASQVLVPAKTAVRAGKDATGQERIYETTTDLVVNQAKVGRLCSVFTDQQVTGLREARERRDPGTNAADRYVRMFRYALGDPGPGDELPPYHGANVDLALLTHLGDWVVFATQTLKIELYELRLLWQLKTRRDGADAEWSEINSLLQLAGRSRTNDQSWALNPEQPRAFYSNLETAIGATPDELYFAGLAEVRSIEQLYALRQRALRENNSVALEETNSFIHQKLHFESVEQFDRMMFLKTRSDQEWRDINRILELAGQRARDDRSFRLQPSDATAFSANLAKAVTGRQGFQWPQGCESFEQYYQEIERIEAYFLIPAERYAYVLAAAPGVDPPVPERKWQRIYEILTEAYRAKVYRSRRTTLASVRELQGLDAMFYTVLGEPIGDGSDLPINRVLPFVKRTSDATFLNEVSTVVNNDGGDAVDSTTWDRVYRIAELAQRVREQFPPPVPEVVSWRNLYPFADATKVLVSLGLEEDNTPRWRTFGDKPGQAGTQAPTSTLGWAVTSPLLALSGGERTITVTLGFLNSGWNQAKIEELVTDAFTVEVSGEKGWIQPSTATFQVGSYGQLSQVNSPPEPDIPGIRIELKFDIDAAPITALDPSVSGVATQAPVLRLLLQQRWHEELGTYLIRYAELRELFLTHVSLRTDVRNLSELVLANDEVALDPAKPFEPFGARPAVGARLYLSHPELVDRQLDSITCHLSWMGVPKTLGEHYKNYPITDGDNPATNTSFQVDIKVVESRATTVALTNVSLFDGGDAAKPVAIHLSQLAAATATAYRPDLDAEAHMWPRYLQCELRPIDFQHEAYGQVSRQKSIELAAAIANQQQVVASEYQVNSPYTPKLRSLTVDYTTSTEVLLQEDSAGPERVFHIRPFGSHTVLAEPEESQVRFLPLYANEGELYIGLSGVEAPQQLSLLFQMAEGSANPNLTPATVRWSYLSGDRWHSLHNGNILRDTTRGLINSGIVEFKLDPVGVSTQMPQGYYWIRAAIAANPRSVCDTVDVHTQAVVAKFRDQNNSPTHYERPLPPNSVEGLVEPIPEIAAVLQPYTSFGGRARERAERFYTRVSERLRHKSRALSGWDYERLILDRFPEVYKAKVLPADVERHPDNPGLVEIVVIPDMRGMFPFDPFEPKAPANLLESIQVYIDKKSPAYATIALKNPHYVYVKARFGVRFIPGSDVGFYRARLNDELNRFLSPWGYDEGADIVFGNRIYATSILDFVDRLPYVDYVASIRLFHSTDGKDFTLVVGNSEGYYVSSERPDSVLVAARQHDIDIISEISYEEQLHTGVNHMKVELDFVVG